MSGALFLSGRIVMTAGAHMNLDAGDVQAALTRHFNGDWGTVLKEDAEANEAAVRDGDRILSCYADREGRVFWVITEGDRSATTVLLPGDY